MSKDRNEMKENSIFLQQHHVIAIRYALLSGADYTHGAETFYSCTYISHRP